MSELTVHEQCEPLYMDAEVVICAALRLPDGRVIRCHRHHHAIPIALEMVDEAQKGERVEQGFITSRGRYVDRYEAMQLQKDAGIPSTAPGGYRGKQLFSEDLY